MAGIPDIILVMKNEIRKVIEYWKEWVDSQNSNIPRPAYAFKSRPRFAIKMQKVN